MKLSKTYVAAFIFSATQAYAAYLLHNDMVTWEPLQWLISVVYFPLYLILLMISALMETVFGLILYRSSVFLPYLDDVMWLVGAVILLPINGWLVNQWMRKKQSI
ncbi:hypothetical protein [Motilimonas eburnea]|uniref:hypothetical protein n=1 Tax=Motilimonas eburnea TaxID=1737488 RepID=UPI001E5DE643|nr:hypothetical protein [Motilimonas eburnea]MCE2571181.1 hypothetical protein [Motilimonas eburnea]